MSRKNKTVMFREYPEVVNVDQVCQMLRIGKRKAYQLVHEGKLYRLPCGYKVLISKNSVIDFVLQVEHE